MPLHTFFLRSALTALRGNPCYQVENLRAPTKSTVRVLKNPPQEMTTGPHHHLLTDVNRFTDNGICGKTNLAKEKVDVSYL